MKEKVILKMFFASLVGLMLVGITTATAKSSDNKVLKVALLGGEPI